MMVTKIKMCLFSVMLAPVWAQAQSELYLDVKQNIEVRIEDALQRMTLEEKVALIHAQSKFSSAGVPRLGIPENWTSDGPHGIREEVLWDEWNGANFTNDSCMAFPALTCLAATWNEELSYAYGKAIGEEARYRNKNVLLGPGVNIYRLPLNGRNFEYMGEDPYLASRLVVPYIKGVQSNGVAACVKHYALNNQETDRGHINVIVDDRALHEIYLPAFKAAVQEGHAWAIMGAYNKYKNQHCCHNQYLLNDILKNDWGFDGVVISDWGGVHDTEQAVKNGLDMEFGSWTNGLNWGASNAYDNYYLAYPYLNKIRKGQYTDHELNDKVRRVLRLIFRTNMAPGSEYGNMDTQNHGTCARKIAEEGIVLLKNEKNILPLDVKRYKRILVVGENAIKKMTLGGGSSSLKAKYEVNPLKGISERLTGISQLTFQLGYESPVQKEQDVKNAKDPLKKVIASDSLRAEAVRAAKEADIVIFVGGLNKNCQQDCEGCDRKNLSLPYSQDDLIQALAVANPNIVVALISGNAVSMPWVHKVPAVLEAWYAGSEAGNALASILFGEVCPSGKLPFTFPERLEDCSANVVGEFPGDGKNVNYKEGIFVGYRYADKQKRKPLFAFGHGLSYTTFSYGKLVLDKHSMYSDDMISLTVPVTNTGDVAGQEIVQMYIHDKKSTWERPEKELKGFQKIHLEVGETKKVTFTVRKDALSFYNPDKKKWMAELGDFEVLIGRSSADIKQKANFKLQEK